MEQNKQSAPQNAASEAAVRRQKLADLKAKGILTQEEFDTKKAELLKKLV